MSGAFEPAYLGALRSGELDRRIEAAFGILENCRLCPRRCGVNRLGGERGFCRAGARAEVSSFNPHFGEEAPLVGLRGSGTIFMTRCNLGCIFCQNYDISHLDRGDEVEPTELSKMMLQLQFQGCHNINLVTPTHFVPQIMEAVKLAAEGGLDIPLVYNCGGYESVETLRLLDGIVDIYMPDVKYWDPDVAGRLSSAPDYPERVRESLLEMHRQVGDLNIGEVEVERWGRRYLVEVALRGLLVRHLVLPSGLAGTEGVMQFIAEKVSRATYVNVMAQYRPCYRASEEEALRRPVTTGEYREAVEMARRAGLCRLDK